MTVTMLRFLSDLRFGRVRPQQLEPHFRAPVKDAMFVAELRDAVARDRLAATIDAVEPAFPLYVRLKRLLANYRALARNRRLSAAACIAARQIVTGTPMPACRRCMRNLSGWEILPRIRKLTGGTYTETLADAVRRFQARHGLQADGVLGKDTLAALNALTTRVIQITLSLERLRWLPQLPPGPLIAINIPSFRLLAFANAADAQRATLSMPVVVGRAVRTETPVFIGEMRLSSSAPTGTCRKASCATNFAPPGARSVLSRPRGHGGRVPPKTGGRSRQARTS
jgi:murein L,D-transpeptidase YcbB/YkuD